MRLLFVSKDFLPSIGGISIMVHGLAEACVDAGHEVTVLAPGAKNGRDDVSSYDIRRDTRPQPRRQDRFGWFRYARGTRAQVGKAVEELGPDGIVVGVYTNYADACLRARTRYGIPVVGLVHGFDVLSALNQERSMVRKAIGRVLGFPSVREQALAYLRESDRILANSSAISLRVESLTGRKPAVIGCGVPRSIISAMVGAGESAAGRSESRASLRLPEAPTVGYLGRLVARKNVAAIIESLRELRDCRALIVGDGPMRSSAESLARQLGLSSRVTFAGHIAEARKQEYLRAMDVFCMPSRELGGYDVEGFGIALLEATVAGVPVVGARTGGIPDVVEHEQTGLLADPDEWPDVASCMRRMLEDRELAESCVAAAQARVRDRFNWGAIATRVVAEFAGGDES